MKPPFEVRGRIGYARKKLIDSYLKENEAHTIMLCGRVCKYEPATKTYTWWQYEGYETIRASEIWATIKKYGEQGRAKVFSMPKR